MSTKQQQKRSADQIAESWAAGTKEWQDAVQPLNQEIHEESRRMREAGRPAAEIVAMAARKQREFAEEYHTHD